MLAAPLDLNCRTACAISGTTSDGKCGEHVETAPVGKFARFFDLTDHVIRLQRRNRHGYFRIFEILAAEFLRQRLLKLGLCQTLRLNGAGERQ